jgi:two-component system sensor histidine kinase YesM
MQIPKQLVQKIADRSILTKLIISLFVIVTPLYAFNYMINQISAERNRQEISLALANSINSYNNILEGEFTRLQQMLHQSAMDIAISHLSLMKPDISSTEKTIFYDLIREHLSRIQYSTRFISDTLAYLPIMDSTLSISGPGVRSFDMEHFTALTVPGKPFIPWRDKLYMNAPFITNQSESKGMFILAVEISRETIAAYLSKIMNFERGGTLFFDRQQQWEISARPADTIAAEIKHYISAEGGTHAASIEAANLTVDLHDETYLIVYQYSSKLDTMLVAYAPEAEIFGSLSIYHDFFYFMSILSVLIIIMCSLWLYKLIHKPLRILINGFRRVEIGNLNFSLTHHNKDEFGYLYHRFNDMLRNLDNLVNVVYEQKLLNERSELKRLQSQINPHFLYNNFFVLKRLIRSGQKDKATSFADYLGRYFQFVTRNAADEITLQEDVQHAQTYADIQSVCFDQRITVHFQPVPAEIAHILVPRLILQPLLENSYTYALEPQLSGGCLVVIFQHDEHYVRIIVEDNGKQLSEERLNELSAKLENSHKQTEESTGLLNVHRRIRLKFGPESGIVLSRSSLGGLKTQIQIDIKEVMLDAEAINC